MTGERRWWRCASALVLVVAWTAGVGAEDGLDTARRLYAAAAYDDALKALDRLQPDPAGRATVDIQQQRLLCLVALGRSAEAEQAMTAIVEADPLYVPGAAAAPPRVRAAFQDVRAKLVPAIARAEYERARQAYEAADYDTASGRLHARARHRRGWPERRSGGARHGGARSGLQGAQREGARRAARRACGAAARRRPGRRRTPPGPNLRRHVPGCCRAARRSARRCRSGRGSSVRRPTATQCWR